MAKTVNISEFSIKVRLDSKAALRELKRLEKTMNGFQRNANKAFTGWSKGINRSRRGIGRLNIAIVKLNKNLGGAKRKAEGMGDSFGGLAAAGGMIMTLAAVTRGFMNAAQAGQEYERAVMSINASIAGSEWGQRQVAAGADINKLSEQERNFAAQLALRNGMQMSSTTGDYAKFFAAASNNMGRDATRGLFESFAQLSTVYGLDPEKQKRSMIAFTQMASKNQVMAEELKQQLGDTLPGAMDLFARAMTKAGKWGVVTTKNLYEMMQNGEIVASEVLPYVSQEMYELANANDSYNKALKSTPILMQKMQTAAERFNIGIYNQMGEELAGVYSQLLSLLGADAVAVSLGTIGGNFLLLAQDVISGLESMVASYEAWFNAMSDPEKKEFLADVSRGLLAFTTLITIGIIALIGKILTLPILIGIGLAAAVATLVAKWDEVKGAFVYFGKEIWAAIVTPFEAAWEYIQNIWNKISGFGGSLLGRLAGGIEMSQANAGIPTPSFGGQVSGGGNTTVNQTNTIQVGSVGEAVEAADGFAATAAFPSVSPVTTNTR